VSESLDRRAANLLGALSLAVVDRVSAEVETAAGQTSAGPAALVALHQFLGGRSMDDLRSAVSLTPSGAVRLVDRLATAGLVERRPGSDGRSLALHLTAKGRRTAKRVLAARAEVVGGILAVLDERERKMLVGLAEQLIGAITDERLSEREAGREPAGGWLCRLCDADACGRPDGHCPAATAASSAVSAAKP